MKIDRQPTYSFVILTLILIIIDTILAWASVTITPTVAGGVVSWLFFAVAFMVLFTLWFGWYGAIAAYVGTLVGSGLMVSEVLNQHPLVAVVWAVAGLFQVLIPLAAVRSFGVNLSMENPRDYTYILLFGVVINNLIGAAWAAWTLSLAEPVAMMTVFSAWFIGNAVVCLFIVPLGLKLFTPKMEKHRLYVKNYWD
ncbi:MAG: hypothetical protein M0R30_08420 [Methanoregula sp.]|jgi:hypothetical protein|uniref:hypothetical protein n=1 Tax=Methanoregula sp. TaxID=2052170 RepID=UPI0025EF20E3|nr:hypothetical protein [Methanoregula sp.]MCK9631656.1 hypothetical protein [Methanoregula sp.]